jgi:hypothetical protein
MKGLVDILERLGMKDKNPILKYNQVLSCRVCCILPKGRFLKKFDSNDEKLCRHPREAGHEGQEPNLEVQSGNFKII